MASLLLIRMKKNLPYFFCRFFLCLENRLSYKMGMTALMGSFNRISL